MRIALDARPLAGTTGTRGVGRYVRELVNGLVAADPELQLVALIDRRVRHDWSTHAARPGQIEPLMVKIPPGPQWLWGMLLGGAWLRATRADLWHATFLAPPRVPPHLPWVATIHDLIPLRHPSRFSWKTRFVFERSLAAAVRATRIVCVSAFTARCVTQHFGVPDDRITVIPPAVDIDTFARAGGASAPPLARPYLLHLGGFDPLKGVTDRLLPAFAEVAERDRELLLACTGGPSAWRQLAQRAVRELGLESRVVFLGSLDDRTHRDVVCGARAVVVSSHEEGFGLPAIEALAAGVPLAIGAATASREAAGPHAAATAVDSPAALASAIREALAAPGPGSAAGAARRAHAAHFHPSVIGARMLALYRELSRSAR